MLVWRVALRIFVVREVSQFQHKQQSILVPDAGHGEAGDIPPDTDIYPDYDTPQHSSEYGNKHTSIYLLNNNA